MIKPQNKAKYICFILCIVLEIIAVIGAYAAHYFTKTRMGMLRHVVYLNKKWEQIVNISVVKWIVVLIIVALIILGYILYKRRKRSTIGIKIVSLITLVISILTIYYLFFVNTGINRAYYIISICFIILTVFQHIANYCFIKLN